MITLVQTWLDAARRWLIAFGAIGFFYLAIWTAKYLEFHFVWYFCLIPIFYLLSVLLEKSLVWLVFKSAMLRKWILGKHFIEGYWIEVLLENGKMQSVAILQIVYERTNQYTIKGESYTLTGEYRGSFVTPNTTYAPEEYALKYSYAGKLREAVIAGTGALIFAFEEKKTTSQSFSGHLLDNFHFKGATFNGEKINDLSKIASLRAKKDFMRVHISEQILYQKARVYR